MSDVDSMYEREALDKRTRQCHQRRARNGLCRLQAARVGLHDDDVGFGEEGDDGEDGDGVVLFGLLVGQEAYDGGFARVLPSVDVFQARLNRGPTFVRLVPETDHGVLI